MGDLTKNISRHELACPCGCGFDTGDIETVIAVQACVDHFARLKRRPRLVLDITSACRCESYNASLVPRGAPNSQHLLGRAIDFSIRGVPAADVHAYLLSKYPDKWGIGGYNNFNHLDTRGGPAARW